MEGAIRITPKYDSVCRFQGALAVDGINDAFGFVNLSREEVISLKFENVSDFDTSLNRRIEVTLNGKYQVIDLRMEKDDMNIQEILSITKHRPWQMPSGNWRYYQEWNNAIFLHWQVDLDELKKIVPAGLEIDLYEGQPWVSLVAFTMENIRPRGVPAFSPISNFDEINIRTYVKNEGKTGVYFLSIEGGKWISCKIAKGFSGLPYRYSKMARQGAWYCSENKTRKDKVSIRYDIGAPLAEKTPIDNWLIERYAVFQETKKRMDRYEIHHAEWPVYQVELTELEVDYPRFRNLLNNTPLQMHYSSGVQVIAWDKVRRINGL